MTIFILTPFRYSFAADVWVFRFERIGDKIVVDSTATDSVSKNDDPTFSILEFSKSKTTGAYRLDLIDVSGSDVVSVPFNAAAGKFPITVPYFSIVSRFRVVSVATGAVLLEGDLSRFVTCNANGVCEHEKGENADSCISDCASGNVTFSEQTKLELDRNNGVIRDPKTGETLLSEQPVAAPNQVQTPTGASSYPVPSSQAPSAVESPSTSRPLPAWVIAAFSVGGILLMGAVVVLLRRRRI